MQWPRVRGFVITVLQMFKIEVGRRCLQVKQGDLIHSAAQQGDLIHQQGDLIQQQGDVIHLAAQE